MVPEGWGYRKLGEVAELQRGFDLPSSKRKEGSIPIISSSGVSGFHDEFRAEAPGVVTGRYGSIGEVFYISENYWPLNTALWVKNFHGNDSRYIYYLLSKFDFKKFSDKTGVPGVNRNDLHAVKVPVPPILEQKKIAHILSTWDKAIAITEQMLANSQQQKKALMQQLLTGRKRLLGGNGVRFSGEWASEKLSSLCSIRTGRKDVNEGNPEGEYPFFTCASEPTRSDTYSYDCEALLVAGNGVIGKTHYFKGKFEAYQRTYILSDFEIVDVSFLHQYILYWLMRDIEREKQHGAMPYIKLGLLQNFLVLLPCLSEQREIAHALNIADKAVLALQQKLEALKQEKKALMQQLLTGKRRVKVDGEVS